MLTIQLAESSLGDQDYFGFRDCFQGTIFYMIERNAIKYRKMLREDLIFWDISYV